MIAVNIRTYSFTNEPEKRWIRHMTNRFHTNRGATWKRSDNRTSPKITLRTQIPN